MPAQRFPRSRKLDPHRRPPCAAPALLLLVLWLALGGESAAGQQASAPAPTAAGSACDGTGGPLPLVNENPLRQPFFRSTPRSACPTRGLEVGLELATANHFVDVHEGSRSVFLDAETYRLELAATRAVGTLADVRVEVPLRARGSGFLDAPIERWHALLGLPRGTRPDHPRNRIRYRVAADSSAGPVSSSGVDSIGVAERVFLDEHGADAGLGDVTLSVLRQVTGHGSATAVAVHGSLKLPTGRTSQLFGSGAVDAGAGLAATLRLAGTLWLHADVGGVLLGRSRLSRQGLEQAGSVTEALLGIEWRPGSGTTLLAQVQTETSPLATGVPVVDRRSLLLAWGLRHGLSPSAVVEIAMAEDLRVDTAPDFTLQAAVRWSAR